VVRHLARIDIDGAHARKTRPDGIAPPFERLDEDRYRGEAVGEHYLPDRAGLAQAALELGDLVEAGKLAREPPAGETRGRGLGIFDPPRLDRVARPHHLAGDI